jgi:tetratricopeptide (TPR) repeat protein
MDPSHGLAVLYGTLPRLLHRTGRAREALVTAECAANLARAVQDEWLLAEALWQQGHALAALGRDEEQRCVVEEASRLATGAGHLDILGRTLNSLAQIYRDRGDLATARSYAERALEAAKRLGNPSLLAYILSNRGLSAFVAGHWEDARVDFERAVTLNRQIDEIPRAALPLLGLGRLCHAVGAWDEATCYLGNAATTAQRGDYYGVWPAVDRLLAERDVLEGRPAAACARLAPLLSTAEQEQRHIIPVLPTLAWAHLELGAVCQAADLAAQAITQARARHNRLSLVDALQVQGLVLTRQERWEEAEHSLAEGVELARSMPYPYGEGRLLHAYGTRCMCRRASRNRHVSGWRRRWRSSGGWAHARTPSAWSRTSRPCLCQNGEARGKKPALVTPYDVTIILLVSTVCGSEWLGWQAGPR